MVGRRTVRDRDTVHLSIRPCGGLNSGVFRVPDTERDIHGAILGRNRDRETRRRCVCHSEHDSLTDRVHPEHHRDLTMFIITDKARGRRVGR